jgi:transcription initiation factor TFIIIB Brf1 subunit/transcription initiation factor TFIIB
MEYDKGDYDGEDLSKSYVASKNGDKSMWKEMEYLDIPETIKQKADEIYVILSHMTKRGNRKKQLLFFCLYNAYIEMRQPQDPKSIAKMIGLTQSEITKAFTTYADYQTGYKPRQITITPFDLIPKYCKELNLTKEIQEEILNFAKNILNKDPSLYQTFPQKVAAGIIKYYLSIGGIEINRSQYSQIIDLSEVTINTMYKRIASIDNK